MADLDLIKRNLGKMIDAGAPKEHLDGYLASEGFNSPDQFRAAVKAPVTSDNIARSFGTGALFNHGDEAAAAVRAAAPGLSNWMMSGPALQRDESIGGPNPAPQTVSTKPTYGERYDEELAGEREKQKDFATAHPNVDLAAKIGGATATTLLGARAIPWAFTPVAGVGPLTRIGGNMLKGGAVGGALGATAGFGEGEGGLENRGQNALTGAMFGGGFGAGLPVLGAVGRAALETRPGRYVSEQIVSPAIRTVANALSPAVPKSLSAAAADGGSSIPPSGLNALADRTGNVAQEGAAQRLATAIQRSGKPAEYWQQQIEKRGAEAVLADLDPQFLNMAVGVKTLDGDTKTLAQNVLAPRAGAAPQRMTAAAEGEMPSPSNYQLVGKGREGDALVKHARAIGKQAYGAMDEAGLKQTPQLMKLYENPEVSGAMDRVLATEKSARIGRPDAAPASPVEIMHMVKQEIQGLGYDKMSGKPLSTQQIYRDLANDFVSKLKTANPSLAEADTAYSAAKSLPDYYNAGVNFIAKGTGERATASSAAGLADILPKANALQQATARAGATNTIRAADETGSARTLARRIAQQGGPMQQKLEQLYGPKDAARIIQQAETEGLFANTENRLMGGPHTADDLVSAGSMGGGISLRATDKNLQARAIEHLGDIINRVVNPNMAVRNALGRTLINTDAGSNAAALRRAGEIMRKRMGGNALAPGLSAGSAEAGGNY